MTIEQRGELYYVMQDGKPLHAFTEEKEAQKYVELKSTIGA